MEGRSSECFIRDYRAAFRLVTGEQLPQGLTLGHTLLKMKASLEARRDEWIMVIFDLQYYLEEDMLSGLHSSNLFLPDWCRILVTTSDVRAKIDGSVDQDEAMACGLKFAKRATCLHVTTLDEARTKQYIQDSGLESQDLDFPAFRHKTASSIPTLRLALSCASMRLLRISAGQLHLLCLQKAKEGTSPMWPGYTVVFADTLAVLWDAINDFNTAAVRLLAMCTIVDRRDIPIHLLQQFPEFQDHEEQFASAINILLLSGLIEIDQKDGKAIISLHLLPYRWLQLKFRRIQDEDESSDLIQTWVAVLNEYLTLPGDGSATTESTFCPDRFWPVFSHVAALCDLKPTRVHRLSSIEYVLFLKRAGIFIAEDGLMPSLAGVAISHALKMCGFLRMRSFDGGKLAREYIHIRQIRAMAFLKVSEYRQGEIELRDAKQMLNSHFSDDAETKSKLRQIQDVEAHLFICQSKWQDAIRLLEELLESPEPDVTPAKIAQRHYWMSTCKGALDEDLPSLQHSQ